MLNRYILLLLFLVPVFLFAGESHRDSSVVIDQPKVWFAKDKGQHLLGSFMLTGVLTLSQKRFGNVSRKGAFQNSVTITFSFGLAKEVFDAGQKNNRFSWPDLAADLAGIALAYVVFR